MVSAFQLPKTRPRSCSGSARFCLSVCLCACLFVFFSRPFFDDFYEEFNYDFKKNTLKKWVLQPISVGEAEHFRGHLAEVVALSSSGDCGATFPSA